VSEASAIDDLARQLSPKISALVETVSPRANSLIVTVFGDVVVPRGGTIWLGSLIALLAPFGLSERLVRTGVYRLTRDGWFTASHKGRRSCYSLSSTGNERFASAEQRIYANATIPWDKCWTLVHFTSGMDSEHRQAVRRELRWLGFGQLSRTLNAHPSGNPAGLKNVLEKTGAANKAIVFHARADDAAPGLLREISADAWDQDQLNADYQQFLQNFGAFAHPESLRELTPLDAFCLRVVLIHEYRRILLKDPGLPAPLVPANWAGGMARERCGEIYHAVHGRADVHAAGIIGSYGSPDDPVVPLSDMFWKRFGGLASGP
jgi:phenylacetic acid degradation operon negative regulatory protein